MPTPLTLILAFVGAFGVACLIPAAPSYEVQAIDARGNLYVAGSGDSCKSAWRNAKLPRYSVRTVCVSV